METYIEVSDEHVNFPDFGRPVEVAVLGAGSWGTALAALLGNAGHSVRLWAREDSLVSAIRQTGENTRYLPGVRLPGTIAATAELPEAVSKARAIVFAVPSGAVGKVAQSVRAHLPGDSLLVSAAKGLEESTGLRMSQVLAEEIADADARLATLSGPNLAVEVARGMPTASVAAGNSAASAAAQKLFTCRNNPTFRVYTSRDVIGVEMGGAVKNVIAIGAGVCDGLGYGDNSKAALMTRGLNEAIGLGVAMGAQAQTFLGLSGVGDLIATGASRLSRNYRVGRALGEGGRLADILAEIGQVAEGVPTTHVLLDLAKRTGVEMPLCSALRAILFDDRAPSEVIRELMRRPPKEESLPV